MFLTEHGSTPKPPNRVPPSGAPPFFFMLEIVRGRTWTQTHTVLDSEDPTDFADLSVFVQLRSQIREKSAIRNKKGIFEHKLVVEVAASRVGSVITQFLTRTQTDALAPGEYLIDLVGFDDEGVDEPLLEPEAIKVTNRPTSIRDLDLPAQEIPTTIPDFGDWLTEAVDD